MNTLTFNEYFDSKYFDEIKIEIIEHLAYQSSIYDPKETMDGFLVEFIRGNTSPAFAKQSGRWGNMAKGVGGMLRGGLGAAATAVGGAIGGAAGTAGGLARSTGNIATGSGTSSTSNTMGNTMGGVQAGSSLGRQQIGKGIQNVKDSFANRKQAAMVSAYRKSTSALEDYINAATQLPNAKSLVPNLTQIKRDLEAISKSIDSGGSI